MSKTYFVDSENVGDAWIDLLLADPNGTFLTFLHQSLTPH